MANLQVLTPHLLFRLARPEDISPTWKEWLADPATARQCNFAPSKQSTDNIKSYLEFMQARRVAVLLICDRESEKQLGLLEVTFDRKQKLSTLSLLLPSKSAALNLVVQEGLPAIQSKVFDSLGAQKIVMLIPSSWPELIDALRTSDWLEEGTLREEFARQSGRGRTTERLDGVCFARFAATVGGKPASAS